MRKPILLCLMITTGLFCITSCNDKNDEFDDKGSSSILSFEGPESAYMGDSITFSFKIASNGIRPNQSKVQLFFDETIVSERIILSPENGEYTGKLLIPFMKNIPDGTVSVKLRIQNERFANAVTEKTIKISRPKFEKLILKDIDGNTHDMLPSAEDPYTYVVSDNFPSELFATIEAPKYGTNGNAMTFGNSDGKITNGVKTLINFSGDKDGVYPVTFNTKTYQGTPFIKFAVYRGADDEEGVEFEKVDDLNFKVECDFKQGEDIRITGLKEDYINYWINPTFFAKVKGTEGKTLRFLAADGKYRLTVVKSNGMKHFKIQTLNAAGTGLGNLIAGDNAMWCVGDGNIGWPSYTANKCNWDANKGGCLAPMGNGIYKLVLKKGETINTRNFKFYSGSNWEGELKKGNYKSFEGLKPFFDIPADDGNIKSGAAGLVDGKYYVITLDVSANMNEPVASRNKNAVATAEELDEIPEAEPYPGE